MRALLFLAVASLIGICTCAYMREESDFSHDAIDDREIRDAADNIDQVDEDVKEREKRRKGGRNRPAPFIVGGAEVTPHSAPMMVSLQAWWSHMCGGVLIHRRWVLTAAHCLGAPWDPWDFEAVAGAHDLTRNDGQQQTIGVYRWIIHSGYDPSTYDNDIALVELSWPFQITSAVNVVSLPSGDAADGTACKTFGWGTIDATHSNFPDTLYGVGVPIVAQSTCRRNDWLGSTTTVTDNMLCAGTAAGGLDTCTGDSGGPLLCTIGNQLRVSGITSNGDGCGLPRKPGVYARVSRYLAWIHQQTGGDV